MAHQCFRSLIQGDLAEFKRTTDAPFHMFGEPTHKREELEAVFNNNPIGVRGQPFYPVLAGVAPLSEFGQASPGQNAGPEDVRFVTGYGQGQLVLFVLQQQQFGAANQMDGTQGSLFLVRLTGDQPRVVGINQNRQGIKYN